MCLGRPVGPVAALDAVDHGAHLERRHLIATKILAGRPKDVEDVRGILRERLPALDIEFVRSTLARLEDALG